MFNGMRDKHRNSFQRKIFSLSIIISCPIIVEWLRWILNVSFRNGTLELYFIFNCSACIFLLFAQLTLAIQYAFCLHEIGIRFYLLNQLSMIANISNRDKIFMQLNVNDRNDEIAMINRWARLHHDLANAVRIINKCYALSIVIKLATDFSYIIISGFEVYRRFKTKSMEEFNICIKFVSWSLFYIFQICIIIVMGQWTTNEVCMQILVYFIIINRSG